MANGNSEAPEMRVRSRSKKAAAATTVKLSASISPSMSRLLLAPTHLARSIRRRPPGPIDLGAVWPGEDDLAVADFNPEPALMHQAVVAPARRIKLESL